MRGIEDFQKYIEEHCPGAYVPVDLLKITQTIGVKHVKRLPNQPPIPGMRPSLCLVLDGEHCLDRLYGGFFNDWCCGGQWNRMVQFLNILLSTVNQNGIRVVVFFNGALEMHRVRSWTEEEELKRNKVRQILRHVRLKRTPPPKVLWMPPGGLRTALRLALRFFSVPVLQSTENHIQEVMHFLRRENFDAVVAEGAEYMFYDPPRYFSSSNLKLTFRGSLETKELIMDEVAKQIDLHPNRMCLLAAMLGSHIMPCTEFKEFYQELLAQATVSNKEDSRVIIPALAVFVRNLVDVEDMEAIGNFVFQHIRDDELRLFLSTILIAPRRTLSGRSRSQKAKTFEESVCYYQNAALPPVVEPSPPPKDSTNDDESAEVESKETLPNGDQSVFASEDTGGELDDVKSEQHTQLQLLDDTSVDMMKKLKMDDDDVSEDRSATVSPALSTPGGNIGTFTTAPPTGSPPATTAAEVSALGMSTVASAVQSELREIQQGAHTAAAGPTIKLPEFAVPQVSTEVVRTAYVRHVRGLMHPWIYQVLKNAELKFETIVEETLMCGFSTTLNAGPTHPYSPAHMGNIAGMMGYPPHHAQISALTNPPPSTNLPLMPHVDFLPTWQIYRPIRQTVYAILFNLNHKNFLQSKEKESPRPGSAGGSSDSDKPKDPSQPAPTKELFASVTTDGRRSEPGKYPTDNSTRIFVKEWVFMAKRNQYQYPEMIPAVALEWRGIPTVARLWFGQQPEDKRKRLKAFLNCMRSDCQNILDQNCVPQHLLLICCVLRYMISYPEKRLLQLHELDAFLAQAVSTQLSDPQALQDIPMRSLTPRGVQLASIFMQGIEHALFANDACGAPIPWVMCCPWNFFDGKLFQMKLDIAEQKPSVVDICNNDPEQVDRVERLRSAVLEGMEHVLQSTVWPGTHCSMGLEGALLYVNMGYPSRPIRGGGMHSDFSPQSQDARFNRRGGGPRGPGSPNSHQLQVAGQVTGQWTMGSADRNRSRHSPQGGPANFSNNIDQRGGGHRGIGGGGPMNMGRGGGGRGGMLRHPSMMVDDLFMRLRIPPRFMNFPPGGGHQGYQQRPQGPRFDFPNAPGAFGMHQGPPRHSPMAPFWAPRGGSPMRPGGSPFAAPPHGMMMGGPMGMRGGGGFRGNGRARGNYFGRRGSKPENDRRHRSNSNEESSLSPTDRNVIKTEVSNESGGGGDTNVSVAPVPAVVPVPVTGGGAEAEVTSSSN